MLRSPTSKPIISERSTGVPPPAEGRAGLATAAVLGLLRCYKVLISPLFAGSCRFQPSCSEYMAEAVRVHGVIPGVWLGCRRLARCHPFRDYGVDPVPHNH